MRALSLSALLLLTSTLTLSAQTNVSFELKRDATPVYGEMPIVTGDFNKDGKPDMVYGGGVSSTDVTMRLGNGDGTFRAPVTIGSADSAQIEDMVVGDFDHDGYLDVAVACIEGTFDVFFGGQGGTFPTTVRVATQASTRSITAADFNGDGLVDIAIGDSSGQVELYNGASGRTFVLNKTIPVEANAEVLSVRAGDFDNDGVQSFGVLTDDAAYALWNDGRENFTNTTLATYPDVSGAANAAGLSVGDLNQDGMADIIVSFDCNPNNETPGRSDPTPCQGITAFYGQGQHRFFQRSLVTYTGAVASSSVQAADVNGDGVGDLVSAGHTGGADAGLFVWLGHPDGSYDQTPSEFIATSDSAGPLAMGDFNRDGMMDFLTAMPGSAQTEIYLNATNHAPCSTSRINPTVTVCAPIDNTYLPGPNVHVQANAYDTKQVTAIQLYSNGYLETSLNSNTMNQSFPLGDGYFFLVVKAWDYTGANFRSQRHITVYSGTPGAVCPTAPAAASMCLPSGATSGSPVHILANGYTSIVPTSAQLYIDGKLTIEDNGCIPNGGCVGGTSFVDTYQNLPKGTHNLVFKLWDADGNVYTAQKNVTVQ